MESQGLQELVKKIFGDEATKAQFAANPESVMAKFALTEDEKKAVMSSQAKMGLVGTNSATLEIGIQPLFSWR